MSASPAGSVPSAPVEPLDPDSERGKQVAADLGQIFADIDARLEREATAVAEPRKTKPA